MAVAAGRLARQRAATKAKERRQKQILVVGLLLLVGIMAWQGPKTLKRLSGGSTTTTSSTAAPSTPATAVPPGSAVPGSPVAPTTRPAVDFGKREATIRDRFRDKDVFVPQLVGDKGTPEKTAPAAHAPAVRTSGFVLKDPFVAQLRDATQAPTTSPGDVTAPPIAGKGSYIVVVASIPVERGRSAASRVAKSARAAGLSGVGVLESSSYATLRSGFYVVYLGRFTKLQSALQAMNAARSRGFPTAYSRALGSG